MKNSIFLSACVLLLMSCSNQVTNTEESAPDFTPDLVEEIITNPEIDYKGSRVYYFGSKHVTESELLEEAKLIDIADRRFETKWVNKDAKGISEEYTSTGAVFMKPGTKPRLGRTEIEEEFAISVQGTDRVEFYQDELQFVGDLDVAFQRCHMLGYMDDQDEHVFEGSYVIFWKKVDGDWLIEYDMFNSDK